MKKVLRHIAPAVFSLACLSSTAWAQTASESAVASAPAAAVKKHAPRAAQRRDFVEDRLGALHAQLKITSNEMPQWEAFAQTMRDSSQKTQAAYRDRADKLSTMTADDAMKSYADLAQMHADNTQKLAAAFSTLYAALSDDQKKTADVLFRDQYSHPQHGSRKRRAAHAGTASSASAAAPASAASN